MKTILLMLLIGASAYPQCQISATASTAGSSSWLDNRLLSCKSFTLTYSTSGASAVTVGVQMAPDNNGSPGNPVINMASETGGNPSSALTGVIRFREPQSPPAAASWVRVTLYSITGGTVSYVLQGTPYPAASNGRFDVTKYGAIGDGTTDSTAAVAKTIDLACSGNKGGQVYFPAGQYLIDPSQLVWPSYTGSGCTFWGDGRVATALILSPSSSPSNGLEFKNPLSQSSYNGIYHMSIVTGNQNFGIGSTIYLTNQTNFALSDVQVFSPYATCLTMSGMQDSVFRDSLLGGPIIGSLDCVDVLNSPTSTTVIFDAIDQEGSTRDGFNLLGASSAAGITISNTTAENNARYNLYAATGVTSINNHFEYAGSGNVMDKGGLVLSTNNNYQNCASHPGSTLVSLTSSGTFISLGDISDTAAGCTFFSVPAGNTLSFMGANVSGGSLFSGNGSIKTQTGELDVNGLLELSNSSGSMIQFGSSNYSYRVGQTGGCNSSSGSGSDSPEYRLCFGPIEAAYFGTTFNQLDLPTNVNQMKFIGTPSVSGCSATPVLGGISGGSFTAGVTGTCTVTVTPGITAANGFSCWASNEGSGSVKQTGHTATTATLSGTTVTGDKITYGCFAF